MWTEQTASGKTRFVERFNDPITGKERKTSITVDKATKAIEKQMPFLLQEKIDELIAKILEDSKTKALTFSELADKWLKVYNKMVKASTYLNVSRRVEGMKELLGDLPLTDVTPAIVNNYLLNRFNEFNNKYGTVNNDKSTILRILYFGVKYGYCEDQGYKLNVSIPKINNDSKKKRKYKYLEREEVQEVYKQLEDMKLYEIKRLCQLQVLTGMRFNEMVALDYVEDIDLENMTIHIHKNYDFNNNIITSTKTEDDRTIYINDEIKELIQEQIKLDLSKKLKHNIKRDNNLLFKQKNGKPILLRVVNRHLKKLDINGKNISSHIFRHTFITIMIENKVDIHLIAQHVGHSNIKMIMEVYSHFSKHMDEELKDAIGNLKIV